ncbi:MAG: hypothetical protein V3V03_06475 [Hyphomonadaceae bacterium]
MQDFTKAVFSIVVFYGVIFGVTECSMSQNGNRLQKVLDLGDYCTPSTISSCSANKFLVIEPNSPALADHLERGDISEFVPASVCFGGRFVSAVIDGQYWAFCELQRDPRELTYDQKLNAIDRMLNER